MSQHMNNPLSCAQLDSLRWISQRRSWTHLTRYFTGPHRLVYVLRYASWLSKTPHFWGLCTPAGGYDPQIWTWPRFLCNTPTPKFHRPMFTRLEVIVLTNKPTNKQTPPKISNVFRYATTLGNQHLHVKKPYKLCTYDVYGRDVYTLNLFGLCTCIELMIQCED